MHTISNDFNELLGIRFEGGEAGRYLLELTIRPDHCHDRGSIHGGVYLSLLDTVMSRAVRTLLTDIRYAPTMTLSASFFRPMRSGTIRAEGAVINLSRRAAHAAGKLICPHGKLLAQASADFLLID